MLLQSLDSLGTFWWQLSEKTLKCADFQQTSLQKSEVVIAILEEGHPVAAKHGAEFLDPSFAAESLLATEEDLSVLALDDLGHFNKLAIQHGVPRVEVAVLLAENHDGTERQRVVESVFVLGRCFGRLTLIDES